MTPLQVLKQKVQTKRDQFREIYQQEKDHGTLMALSAYNLCLAYIEETEKECMI